MTDNLEALPERIDRIEQQLDSLAVSVDKRFDDVDNGFAEVSEAFAEQRRYTEFTFEHVDKKLTAMDRKIDEILRLLRR